MTNVAITAFPPADNLRFARHRTAFESEARDRLRVFNGFRPVQIPNCLIINVDPNCIRVIGIIWFLR